MKVERIRFLKGANVFRHESVMVMELDPGELGGVESRAVHGFNERLLQAMPGLREHSCDSGHAGGFVDRLNSGTHFNHVIEHITLEMLAQAGLGERSTHLCTGNEKDPAKAIVETTVVETTRYLMPEAVEIVESLVEDRTVAIETKVMEAKDIAADTELGPSTMAVIEAAERRNIPWSRENDRSLVQLGYGRNLHQIQAALTDRTAALGVDLAGNKDLTKRRLRDFSIPVPKGVIISSEDEAAAAIETVGVPLVVKPLDGRQGKGVSLGLSSTSEVAEAFRAAREYSSRVIVEEQLEGKNYRVLVIDGKMTAASERLPCHIKGHGTHTIGDLIERENQNPLRGEGHEKPLTKIKVTPIVLAALKKDGWEIRRGSG